MKLKTLISLFFLSWSVAASAQQFYFKRYMVENGLSHNSVLCVLEDSHGFIWFGTADGLNRFDSHQFAVYRNKLVPGTNPVNTIIEVDGNTLWVGTNKGVFVFDRAIGDFSRFEAKTRFGVNISSEVRKIIRGRNGFIWMATMGQGVFIYDPAQDVLIQNNLQTTLVWDIDIGNFDRVYVSTIQDGLLCYDQHGNFRQDYTSFPASDGKSVGKIDCVACIDQHVWFGTGTGTLYMLDSRTGNITSYDRGEIDLGTIKCISPHDGNALFVGSNNGLYLFDMESRGFRRIDSPVYQRGLSDQQITGILKDSEGGIWIATNQGGVNYLARQAKYFDHTLLHAVDKVVNAFCEAPSGDIWIGTQGGLWKHDRASGSVALQKIGGHSSDVRTLLADGDRLWIGTYGDGIKILDTKNGKVREFRYDRDRQHTLCGDEVLSMCRTRAGVIYIGTSWGMCRYDSQSDRFYTMKAVGSTIPVVDIIEDREEALWIATYESGLFRCRSNGVWSHHAYSADRPNSLPGNSIVSLLETLDGRILAAVDGNGVCAYDPKNNGFERIAPQEITVNSMEEDDGGNLWFSTNDGLLKFAPGEREIKQFTKENGLQSNQFVVRSSLKTTSGKFFFGSTDGYYSFFPDHIVINEYIPPVKLVNVAVSRRGGGGKEETIALVSPDRELALAPDINRINITFAALSYESPTFNRYRYRMVGDDDHWIHTTVNSASFANLPPGKYRFEAVGSNNDGVWSDSVAALDITIKPPLWRTKIAFLTYLLLGASGAWGLVRVVRKRTDRRMQARIELHDAKKEKELYQSKIDFFVNLVHEIRTPLSLIKLPLEKIVENEHCNEASSGYLAIIDRNIDYMLGVVNQLLDFQKADNKQLPLSVSEVALDTLLQDIHDQFGQYAALKSRRITLILPDDAPTVAADPEIITKIMFNLLSNAIKYSSGRIDIRLEVSDGDFTIEVADDGKGVPDHEKEKIFGTFYQGGSSLTGGTGIGLAFSKLLTECHRGTLTVSDSELGGAAFTLTIPRSLTAGSATNSVVVADLDPHETAEPDDKVKSSRILLVEDNLELLALLTDMLGGHFHLIRSTNGREALEKLDREAVDLIVSDVMMPEMDGFELCDRVKSDINTSHIPVILLTAKADTRSKIEGMEHGADAFVEKPFSIKYLQKQIENLLKLRLAFQETFVQSPSQIKLSGISNRDKEFMAKLHNEIERHVGKHDFSIDTLSETMFMSRSVFYRKIKALTGMAPNDYLKAVRLNRAAELLGQGSVRIMDVYELVGFSSSSYFAKCFKSQFGMLPKEYQEEQYRKQKS